MPACEQATGCGSKTASFSGTENDKGGQGSQLKVSMKLHPNEVPHLPLMAGSFAAILLGTFVFAAVIEISPASGDETVTALASEKAPTVGSAHAEAQIPKVQTSSLKGKTRGQIWAECEECGIVMSRQQVGRNDAMTVRMNNGSNRIFMDAHPANWRPGERVIFIEGTEGARGPATEGAND